MNNEKLILKALKHILLQTFRGKNSETTAGLLSEISNTLNPKEDVPYEESIKEPKKVAFIGKLPGRRKVVKSSGGEE